jgi:hypothetical protein
VIFSIGQSSFPNWLINFLSGTYQCKDFTAQTELNFSSGVSPFQTYGSGCSGIEILF